MPSRQHAFDNEWIFEAFARHPSFRTKRMFGGLAAYLYDRLMLILVEPTRTGRWQWHGALLGTSREHHASLMQSFPALAPHEVLGKWLYLDSRHEEFESTMEAVALAMARNDVRLGVVAAPAKPRRRKSAARSVRKTISPSARRGRS